MTANQFRRLALELTEAVESAHMGHPDFRVRGKIFATLGAPDDGWGMVKLTPAQQRQFVGDHPDAFVPVPGGWGRKGATYVNLSSATPAALRPALEAAWKNAAPKGLTQN
jgi:hypothetical protein